MAAARERRTRSRGDVFMSETPYRLVLDGLRYEEARWAQCSEPPWYLHTHPCSNPAKYNIDGVMVCGIHKRQAERWRSQ